MSEIDDFDTYTNLEKHTNYSRNISHQHGQYPETEYLSYF